MKNKDYELKALADLPIVVNGIKIITPKCVDIALVGEDKYQEYLGLLTARLDQLINLEEIKNIDKEKLDVFTVLINFCINDKEFELKFFEALSFFIQGEFTVLSSGDDFSVCVTHDNKNSYLTSYNFSKIQEIIKTICCVSGKKEEYNPANKKAQELIKKIQDRDKKYSQPKKDSFLQNICSSVAWKSNIGINNTWNLNIFQLYDAFYRLNIIDNYEKTMTGYYAGTVDLKKHEFKKIDWSKNLNLND